MADGTTHRFPLVYQGAVQHAICLGKGQHGAHITGPRAATMAGSAGSRIILGKVLMASPGESGVPTHRVHAMRAVQRILAVHRRTVAGAAFYNGTGVALELVGRYVVVRIRVGVWPLCMSCTVATLAHHSTVTGAHPVELWIASTGIAEAVESCRYTGFCETLVCGYDRRRLGIPPQPGLAQANTIGISMGVHLVDDGGGCTACQVTVGIAGVTGTATGFVRPWYSRLWAVGVIKIAQVQLEVAGILR